VVGAEEGQAQRGAVLMSVPVIRVVAERIDDVVDEAVNALCESHPGVVEGDGFISAGSWVGSGERGPESREGIRRSELKRALKEAALWVDVNGVPIDPPPVVVRAVGDWLGEFGVIR